MVQKGCAEGVRADALTLDGLYEVVRLFLNEMQVGREGGREGGQEGGMLTCANSQIVHLSSP